MRTKLLTTLVAAAVLACGIFLHVEIRANSALAKETPSTNPQPAQVKVAAPQQDNVVLTGAPAEPSPPAAAPQPSDPTPEPKKCEDNDGCSGSDLCDRGVCITDPCTNVVFSSDDSYGCKMAQMLHYHGVQDGDALNYLIKLGHGKHADKKLERFSKELEARARRVYWQTKGYDIDAASVAALKPSELREKMEDTATIGDLMHLTVRMDQKVYAATHKKADQSTDVEPVKEETTKK
ncbi:MAG: hypothetical protein NTZ25_03445 [Candidatus Peregrinibacteria bacterium]|nr:hypothetical protein [Candidatus Peregrinibacteria bacterium]